MALPRDYNCWNCGKVWHPQWERACTNCGAEHPQTTARINREPGPAGQSGVAQERRFSVAYDPAVIRGYANRLYAVAGLWIIGAVVVGAAIGFALGQAVARRNYFGEVDMSQAVVVAIVGGAIGFAFGLGRATSLRLEAQLALCMVMIEQNTRATSTSTVRSLPTGSDDELQTSAT